MLMIVAFAVVGTGLAIGIGVLIPPKYTATSAVAVDTSEPHFSDIVASERVGAAKGGVETKIALLNSRPLQVSVMDQLQLWDDPLFNPTPLPAKLARAVTALAALLPDSWLGTAHTAPLPEPADEPAAEPRSERAREAAYERFRLLLLISQASSASEVVDINFTLSDPAKAAAIANALADGYVKWEGDHRQQTAKLAAGWLDPRIKDLKLAVAQAEKAAADYRTEHGLSGVTTEVGTINDERLADLRKGLISFHDEQLQLKTKIARVRAARNSPDQLGTVLDSPLISQLRSQLVALENQRTQFTQSFGPRHPKMLDVEVQIRDVDQRIRAEVDHAIASMQDDLAMLTARGRTIASDIKGLQGGNVQDRQAEVELRELERQAKATRDQYEAYLTRYGDARQEETEVMRSKASVVSRAAPPALPTTPGPVIIGFIGLVGSSLLGAMLSFLLERLDGRVLSAAQLERALNIPSLGVLPQVRSHRMRNWPASYIAEQPLTYFAEAAQAIATRLRPTPGSEGAIVIVTSSLPDEGKTTLAVSIAAAVVQAGGRSIVVDLDLRRPSVAGRLEGGRNAPAGLAEFLRGKATRDEILHHDQRSGIDFITSGRVQCNPLRILQDPALDELLQSLRTEYDQIIMDSSPALAVSETTVACQLADRVLLAVRWKRTDVVAATETLKRLAAGAVPRPVDFVLSRVNVDKYRLYAQGESATYFRQYRKYYTR